MATSKSAQQDTSIVRIVDKLSEAFHQLQTDIRERAYHLFLQRGAHEGDPDADWLSAQAQLVTPLDMVLKEQKKNFVVEGNLKGFSPREIEIEVGLDELRIFGVHDGLQQADHRGEGSYHTRFFYRAMPLPPGIDPQGCTARLYKNGKLSISLPRQSPLK